MTLAVGGMLNTNTSRNDKEADQTVLPRRSASLLFANLRRQIFSSQGPNVFIKVKVTVAHKLLNLSQNLLVCTIL